MSNEEKAKTIDIDVQLWRDVTIACAELDIYKKEFVDMAFREKLNSIKNNSEKGDTNEETID